MDVHSELTPDKTPYEGRVDFSNPVAEYSTFVDGLMTKYRAYLPAQGDGTQQGRSKLTPDETTYEERVDSGGPLAENLAKFIASAEETRRRFYELRRRGVTIQTDSSLDKEMAEAPDQGFSAMVQTYRKFEPLVTEAYLAQSPGEKERDLK